MPHGKYFHDKIMKKHSESFAYTGKKSYNMDNLEEGNCDIMAIDMTQWKPHTILLAPAHYHNALRMELTKQSAGMQHITLLSLSAFFKRRIGEAKDRIDVLLQYREMMKRFDSVIYSSIITSLDFLEQCYAMIQDMKLYGIPVEELPQHTLAQAEMKRILAQLYPIPTVQDQENEVWKQLSVEGVHDVWILEQLYSAQDSYRIQRLCALGADIWKLPVHTPHITYTKSMNKRKETEALAQMIIQQNRSASDLHIMVCDPSYQPLITQVFERYHIPVSILSQMRGDSLSAKAVLLLRYVCDRDMATLIELLEQAVIQVPHRKEFCDYVQLFGKQLSDPFDHVRAHTKITQLLSEDELQRLCGLEERAQISWEAILIQLAPLHEAKGASELLEAVDQLLRMSIHPKEEKAAHSLLTLQDIFRSFLPYYKEMADLSFLMELCEKTKLTRQAEVYCGAWVSELSKPLAAGSTCVLLGCTQKNYPAFPLQTGLFDEAYVKEIANYPTMDQRYREYMAQLKNCLFSYEELLVSYPFGDYEGNANESSLEMDQLLAKRAQLLEPLTMYRSLPLRYEINEASARTLFVHEGVIRGSISSLETYVRCPFSYFLKYGLRLKEPIDYHFSQSRIGTLSHYILEQAVSRYGKEYTRISVQEVADLLNEELEKLSDVYVLLKDRLPILQQRLLDHILSNLNDLDEAEAHSHLTPTACEQEFYQLLDMEDGIQLRLHGFIDRMDENKDFLRIIDYKSSIKELKETQVFAGLQLQLLIYALYAKAFKNKRVLGVFYRSLKKENIQAKAGKMNRRLISYQRYDNSDWEEARKRAHRLRGWILDSHVEVMDDDGSHIVGVRQNKDGAIKAGKIYSIDSMEVLFHDMLKQITKRILQGDISCSPSEDACLFCPYHEVCRFYGYTRKEELLVDPSCLHEKGEE